MLARMGVFARISFVHDSSRMRHLCVFHLQAWKMPMRTGFKYKTRAQKPCYHPRRANLMIVAGEPSGDAHAAALVNALRAMSSGVRSSVRLDR